MKRFSTEVLFLFNYIPKNMHLKSQMKRGRFSIEILFLFFFSFLITFSKIYICVAGETKRTEPGAGWNSSLEIHARQLSDPFVIVLKSFTVGGCSVCTKHDRPGGQVGPYENRILSERGWCKCDKVPSGFRNSSAFIWRAQAYVRSVLTGRRELRPRRRNYFGNELARGW